MKSLGKRLWKGAKVVATDVASAVGGIRMLWNLNLVIITNTCAMHHYRADGCNRVKRAVQGSSDNATKVVLHHTFKHDRRGKCL